MAITPEQISEVTRILGEADSVRAAAASIRERFAPLRTLVLDPFDMKDEEPVAQAEQQRALYLMATDGHCWTVTREPAQAHAFVLTQA
jgi:hypothetical protein